MTGAVFMNIKTSDDYGLSFTCRVCATCGRYILPNAPRCSAFTTLKIAWRLCIISAVVRCLSRVLDFFFLLFTPEVVMSERKQLCLDAYFGDQLVSRSGVSAVKLVGPAEIQNSVYCIDVYV